MENVIEEMICEVNPIPNIPEEKSSNSSKLNNILGFKTNLSQSDIESLIKSFNVRSSNNP